MSIYIFTEQQLDWVVADQILQGLFTLFTGTVGSEAIDFGDAQNPKAREEYYQV